MDRTLRGTEAGAMPHFAPPDQVYFMAERAKILREGEEGRQARSPRLKYAVLVEYFLFDKFSPEEAKTEHLTPPAQRHLARSDPTIAIHNTT